MPKITFLQIGDVHYPDWTSELYQTDDKDRKVSASIKFGITHNPFRRVLTKIVELSSKPHMNGVVLMGDFTSKGDKKKLASALNHFSWLCKEERERLARPHLMAVPGNHDVNKDDAVELGQTGKFQYLNEVAEECLWHPMPVDEIVHIPIEFENATANFLLVNTTLGSWEKYLLPPSIEEGVDDSNKKTSVGDPAKLSLEMAGISEAQVNGENYYDQLDTPYVSSKSTLGITKFFENIERKDAVIVVGHHNILPQIQPRLSPYSEMLNAGFFRKSLLEQEFPMLYLHGHVHHDVIEIIQNPRLSSSKIYSIGAPDITQGFNEVSLFYDRDGRPTGFRVLPWRFSKDRSHFKAKAEEQVVGTLYRESRIWPSAEAQKAFEKVNYGKSYNGSDLVDIFCKANVTDCEDEVESILLELFFLKWIQIENVGKQMIDWVVIKRAETSND